jgi:ATP-dependent protease HslVU (ClpYQ) peptidase subunit
MTCIVGVVAEGRIYMGGDSASVRGLDVRLSTETKVFVKGGMIFGLTGSWRTLQLVRYRLDIPEHRTEKTSDREYLTVTFVDALRQCLKSGGLDRKDDGEDHQNSVLMLGYRGHLYVVWGDYSITEYQDSYQAVGCGEDYALGALHATEDLSPRDRITKALESAARFSAGVSAPFTIEELG